MQPLLRQSNRSQRIRREILICNRSIRYNKETRIFSKDGSRPLHGIYRVYYLNDGGELSGKFEFGKLKSAVITRGNRTLNMVINDTGVAIIEEKSNFSGLSYQCKLDDINGTTEYKFPKQESESYSAKTTIYSKEPRYFPPDGAIAVVEQFFPASSTLLRRSGKYSGCSNKPFGNSLNSFEIYIGENLALRAAKGYPITINDSGEIVGYCRLDTINPECLITEEFLFVSGGIFARVVVCTSEQFVDSKYHYLLDISAIQVDNFRALYRERETVSPIIKDAQIARNTYELFYLMFNYNHNEIDPILSTLHPELLYKRIDNYGEVVDDILEYCGHISSIITIAKLQHLLTNAVRMYLKLLSIPVLSYEERFYALKKLGDCYVNGDKDLSCNFSTAVNYYKEALNVAKFLPKIASVHVLVNISFCYNKGDKNLPVDLEQARIYYNQFTEVWKGLTDSEKQIRVDRYCQDSKIPHAIYLCCHELELQATCILRECFLSDLVKNMMNTIYISIKFDKAKVTYASLPDTIKKHDYQCPLSLTQFNHESEKYLEELEVIICATPRGYLTIYEYPAFCNAMRSRRLEHPGMLESVMFIVNPRSLQQNEDGIPIYSIDFTNPDPRRIFWWIYA